MKKTKTYEVSVINKTLSKTYSDQTKFYTSDTALELNFQLKEVEYDFDSAEIILLNIDDRSLVTRPVTKSAEGFTYELEDDIVEHYGEWKGQLKFNEGGEIYVSSPVVFRIENDLNNDRPPQLTDIRDWETLRKNAKELIAEMGDIVANESARIEAEKQRVEGYQEIRNIVDNFEIGENAVGTENINDGAITPEKTTFFEISKNLFNPENVIRNKTFDTSGNVIDDNLFWVNTDFIPVNQGETIRLTPNVYRLATYNESMSFVSRSGTDVNGVYTVSAASIKFIRISGTVDPNTVMLNKGDSLLPFEEFGSRLKESVIPKSITSSVSDAVEKVANMENNQKYVYEPITYIEGTIDSSGAYETGTNAFRTSEDIELSAGDKLTVASGYRIFIVYLTTSGSVKSFAWLEENSVYTANENKKIRFMVRTSENVKPAEIADFVLLKKSNNLVLYGELSNVSGGQGGDVVKYVGLNGSDNNSGDSKSSKYATLQKAINEGASIIFIERGDYYNQSASVTGLDKLTILPIENNSNAKIRFYGADKLTGWTADSGIYKLALSNGVNFKEVFTDKTLPPMTSTSRPAPNAVLWEAKDHEIDYMMTPVLTLAECQATQGTFFWDGTTVYINPQNINNDFWLPKISKGIDISGVGHLIAQDLVVDYYLNQPLRLEDISKLEISGVEAHHSAKTDGFSLDYTYGDLKNCKAYKNRNDGYNNHFEGNINLYNCEGINNFDDGASPHENATMTVYGGVYRGNGKGGVIPASGGTARVYNAILQDNKIGFHNATKSKGSISSGNLFIGNETGLRNDTADNDLISVNDKFFQNGTDKMGEFSTY